MDYRRKWAWALAVVGTPLEILACLAGLDAGFRIRDADRLLLGVMALAQSAFALLYLMRRASWVAAAIAGGVWLAWAAITGSASQNIFEFVGTLIGSLLWAGLPLSYLWSFAIQARRRH